jgi:hypothetical protein
VVISVWTGVPISKFTRDPAAIMGAHPLVGVLSNIGVLLWAVCAGVCFFTSAVLRVKAVRGGWPEFFLFAGFITMVLLGDDLFLMHEKIVPRYLHVGEKTLFSLYALMLLGYLVAFRRLVLTTDYLLLVLALGLFAVSVAVDRLPETLLPWHHLYEDGTKFLGIVGWFGYFVSSAFTAVTSRIAAVRPD